jgi:HSP20 family protein
MSIQEPSTAPVRTVDGHVIIESTVIMLYVDEAFPGPRLMPADAHQTQTNGGRTMDARELEHLQQHLATLFGRAPIRTPSDKEEALTVAKWAPLVDIIEHDREYLIKAELPEVKKDDVKVTVQDDVLTITGERTLEKEEKGNKYHRVERAYGRFARSFTLPEDTDGSKVAAEFKDGVLKVHLPKSERAQAKSIEVKIG